MSRLVDETGNKYFWLTVIEKVFSKNFHGARWRCKCDCGKECIATGYDLRVGKQKSCGCYGKEQFKLPLGTASFRQKYKDTIRKAVLRGYRWDLTEDQARTVMVLPCHYCGNEPSQHGGHQARMNGIFLHNGIDRVDNTKDYTIDNIVPCCKACNKAKGTMDSNEFFGLITRIYNHNRFEQDLGGDHD